MLAGYGLRQLVEQTGLDIRMYPLRFNNDWHYVLSGRNLNTDDTGPVQEVKAVYVDVLVETKEGSVLYCGLLDEFYLSEDGVDRICLYEVYRRRFDQDIKDSERMPNKSFDERYYKMPGDLFVIPYSQIRNLNLTYYGPVRINAPNEAVA